jgi:hypothetical protein
MEGGVKVDAFGLPAGAERVPIEFVAVNVDTGEYDVWGSKGMNFVTVSAQGNFRDGSYRAKVCVGWVKCFNESQAAGSRSGGGQGAGRPRSPMKGKKKHH